MFGAEAVSVDAEVFERRFMINVLGKAVLQLLFSEYSKAIVLEMFYERRYGDRMILRRKKALIR